MAFYGYLRVSTEKQASEGVSLSAQERVLTGMAMQHGSKIAAFFREDGVSGAVHLSDRPQGRALLDQLQKGDVILATRLDRLFRSAFDALRTLEDFKAKGVRVIFGDIGDTDSTNGKLMLTILAGVAEAERGIIRERVRAVKRAQNGAGRYLGGRIPFGHEVAPDGALVLAKGGAEARAMVGKLRKSGKPLRAIAEEMTKRGWPISHVAVKEVADVYDAERLARRDKAKNEARKRAREPDPVEPQAAAVSAETSTA